MAVSKHAAVVFGLSLVASTASASIPDANGVIHGCYNVLTGSTRIIDGNSCGLLEKSVTWNQTGPQGPVGPRGPVGPQGPKGNSNIVVGGDDADLTGPFPAHSQTNAFASQTYTTAPGSVGVCNIQVHAALNKQVPGTSIGFYAQLDGGSGRTAGYVFAPFVNYSGANDQGSVANFTFHLPMDPGLTYQFGATFSTEDVAIDSAAQLRLDITWTCTQDTGS